MKKITYIFCCCTLLLCLISCEKNEDDIDRGNIDNGILSENIEITPHKEQKTVKVKEEYDSVFQEIADNLEKGNYGKATTLINEQIIGNVSKEKQADTFFTEYADAVEYDFNNDNITYENAKIICEAGMKTPYPNRFEIVDRELDILFYSKESLTTGIQAFEMKDYETAFYELRQVSKKISTYTECSDILYEIMTICCEKNDKSNLELASQIADVLYDSVNFDAPASENKFVSKELYEKLPESLSTAYLNFASYLEENGHYWYAVQQYARAYSIPASEETVAFAESKYRKIMHLLHPVYFECNDDYYKISTFGTVEEHGSPTWNIAGECLEIQPARIDISASSYDCYVLLRTDLYGNLTAKLASFSTGIIGNENFIESIESYETNARVIDIIYLYPEIIVLYSDGTIKGFVHENAYQNSDKRNAFSDIQGWENIIQLIDYNGGGVIGLKSDGTIIVSKDFPQNIRSEISTWKNIVSLSSTYEERTDIIYGLCEDGSVLYVQDSGYENTVPKTGIYHENILTAVGNFYITDEGSLRSFDPAYNQYLIDVYSKVNFKYLSQGDSSYYHNKNKIIAWNSEDNYEIILAEKYD